MPLACNVVCVVCVILLFHRLFALFVFHAGVGSSYLLVSGAFDGFALQLLV